MRPAKDMPIETTQQVVGRLVGAPRFVRVGLMAVLDSAAFLASLYLAVAIRLGTLVPQTVHLGWLLPLAAALGPACFLAFGIYREITRYFGARQAFRVLKACATVALVLAAIVFLAPDRGGRFPRSSFFVFALLAALGTIGVRGLTRVALQRRSRGRRRIAIYGAGDAGVGLAAVLAHDRASQTIAFFDDNPSLAGTQVRGIPVFATDVMEREIRARRIQAVLLALPPDVRRRRAELLESLRSAGVAVLSVPTLAEIGDGRVRVEGLRPIAIEDVLGRAQAVPEAELLAADVPGKVVMVTGAGGSIGSELCRQALRLGPSRLVIVDSGEYNLFQVDMELRRLLRELNPTGGGPEVVQCLASVTDAVRMDQIVGEHRPATIYHAAAYKHVPIVESNQCEGVEVNVFGTLRVAEAAIRHDVSRVVFVSTDKAVRPTSVMGASKRLAEMALQALQDECRRGSSATRIVMVRFGNVLGSSGSVVPIFTEQIARGGPVTVTHEEVTRYFMTIPEAVALILQAGALGKGGEVFVLDMGEPVRIADMARKMIRLAGKTVRDTKNPQGDVAIEFTGLRPGEKMFEELVIGDGVTRTAHPSILAANERFVPWDQIRQQLVSLEGSLAQRSVPEVVARVRALVSDGSGGAERTVLSDRG